MANTRSAEKRNRQAQKRRTRNVQVRTGLKSAVKKAREAIVQADPAAAKQAVATALRTLDKAASKGIIHKNAASRRISRLAKAAAKAAQPKSA
ncbi:30S ribosomal protein S20 [Anaeromyxobacter diazotrophicus]|uniref:Small ribosomal subunit protein bS20 n=1 Tax=Anaeromyxobacter diazotrophicus TaxID=2590199 RepID=A0A7I9VIF1_9BACT|nr:30S ribosomal protein S20 [Anaeromyxobacter diazotrophicus]GEJ56191.1 30S ribosomal protein S20 [Anaeromyxobacter diazotrophicus]